MTISLSGKTVLITAAGQGIGRASAIAFQQAGATVHATDINTDALAQLTAETGIVHEAIKYSRNHRLPIHFIVEDNEKSVCTDTREVWNQPRLTFEGVNDEYVSYYRYSTKYPHAGAGVRVQF